MAAGRAPGGPGDSSPDAIQRLCATQRATRPGRQGGGREGTGERCRNQIHTGGLSCSCPDCGDPHPHSQQLLKPTGLRQRMPGRQCRGTALWTAGIWHSPAKPEGALGLVIGVASTGEHLATLSWNCIASGRTLPCVSCNRGYMHVSPTWSVPYLSSVSNWQRARMDLGFPTVRRLRRHCRWCGAMNELIDRTE